MGTFESVSTKNEDRMELLDKGLNHRRQEDEKRNDTGTVSVAEQFGK